MASLSGGCSCGAIRYVCEGSPVLSAHCHCRDCQRSSGASMATVFAVQKDDFVLLSGKSTAYTYTGDSGNSVIRHFCHFCGSPLFTDVESLPNLWFVRAVSLDEPNLIIPTMHIYCDSAQEWDRQNDGLVRFGKMPN